MPEKTDNTEQSAQRFNPIFYPLNWSNPQLIASQAVLAWNRIYDETKSGGKHGWRLKKRDKMGDEAGDQLFRSHPGSRLILQSPSLIGCRMRERSTETHCESQLDNWEAIRASFLYHSHIVKTNLLLTLIWSVSDWFSSLFFIQVSFNCWIESSLSKFWILITAQSSDNEVQSTEVKPERLQHSFPKTILSYLVFPETWPSGEPRWEALKVGPDWLWCSSSRHYNLLWPLSPTGHSKDDHPQHRCSRNICVVPDVPVQLFSHGDISKSYICNCLGKQSV